MKKTIRVILSILLVAYLAAVFVMSGQVAAERRLAGIKVEINDSSSSRFVTPAEILKELESLSLTVKGQRLVTVNTDSIERFLQTNDKIESVSVVRLTNDSILISVQPMIPVARVFDNDGSSYYINREGKHMTANARYHINVPVIIGEFGDSLFQPTALLPLIDYLSSSKSWESFVTMIKVDSPHDIILVPSIKGHVVNFGSPDGFDSKFARLRKMYRDVLPVKGWQYYDTLSVKWGGQIVATRRDKQQTTPEFVSDEETDDIDLNTMMVADNVAPGQAIAGKKANGEKAIPAARAASESRRDTVSSSKKAKEKPKTADKPKEQSKEKPKEKPKEKSKEKPKAAEKSKEKSKDSKADKSKSTSTTKKKQ